MKKCILISLTILNLVSIFTYSQQTSVGINAITNYTFNEFRPEIGFVFDKQIKIHHGFETGLYYKTFNTDFFVISNGNSSTIYISEQFISLPILYKFYSDFLNISAGLTYDYYIGWNQKNSSLGVTSYSTSKDFIIGLTGKVSKSINLDERLLFEPELRFNIEIEPLDRYYLGLGLVFKYKFSDTK